MFLAIFCVQLADSFVFGQAPSREVPLEIPDGAVLHSEYRKAHLKFCLRELEHYEKFTSDPNNARGAAKKFLRVSLSHFSEQLEADDPPAAEWGKLPELGAAALAAGSNDPIVMAHYVDALLENNQLEQAGKVADQILGAFDQSKYPPGMKMLVLLRSQKVLTGFGNTEMIGRVQRLIYDAAPAWFDYALESPKAQRHAWHIYEQALGHVPPDSAPVAIAAYGRSVKRDNWLWQMQQGRYRSNLAWHLRGNGPSHEIAKDDWRKYVAEIKLAGEHFRQAHELRPDFPEAATAMMVVSRQGRDTNSPWDWFYRAIAAEADYLPAYETALTSLRGRWGGSPREMFDFGEACARTGRFDTEIPYVYVLAAHGVHSELGNWRSVFEEPRLYEKLSYVISRLVDHPSRAGKGELSFAQTDLLTQNLCFAASSDEFADATRLWERLGEHVSPKWISLFNLQGVYARSRIAAYGSHSKMLFELRPLTEKPRTDPEKIRKALAGFQQLANVNRDPKAELYLNTWVSHMKQESDYHAGKWVELTFNEDMNQWIGEKAGWKSESAHTVLASNATTGKPLYLYHECEFPGPKEMTGEIEVVRSLSPVLLSGFYIGMTHGQNAGGRVFGVDPHSGHVSVGAPHQQLISTVRPRMETASLRVKAWGPDRFEFYVNGNRYRPATSDPKFSMERNCVGIGTVWWARFSGEMRFKNLRVRKLVEPPPPPLDDYEKRIAYYTGAIARDPSLADHLLDRAIAHDGLGHTKEAIADFEAGLKQTPEMHWARVFLAELYANSGRSKEAIEQAEMAAKDPTVESNFPQRILAYVLANTLDDDLRDGTRAFELATTAVAIEQRCDPFGLMTQACAQAELGRFQKALQTLNEAEKLNPNARRSAEISDLRDKFQKSTPHRLPAAP